MMQSITRKTNRTKLISFSETIKRRQYFIVTQNKSLANIRYFIPILDMDKLWPFFIAPERKFTIETIDSHSIFVKASVGL